MREWERVERAELYDPSMRKRPWFSTGAMAAAYLGLVLTLTVGAMFWHWWTLDYCNVPVEPSACKG